MEITNWSCHSFYCKESGKVGGVGGDDDEGKEPPDAPDYSGGGSFGVEI